MRAPNIAYAFTSPKDTAGPTLEHVNRTLQVSSSDDPQELFDLEVPKDRIFIVSNILVECNPGGGQNVITVLAEGRTQTQFFFGIAGKRGVFVADESVTLNWSGEVWIAGGGQGTTTLRFFCDFNSGVNSNFLRASYSGIVIPRGNAGAF